MSSSDFGYCYNATVMMTSEHLSPEGDAALTSKLGWRQGFVVTTMYMRRTTSRSCLYFATYSFSSAWSSLVSLSCSFMPANGVRFRSSRLELPSSRSRSRREVTRQGVKVSRGKRSRSRGTCRSARVQRCPHAAPTRPVCETYSTKLTTQLAAYK